ncbi:MAG: chemotaxis protein CheW [Cyanobacteria bacterium P01_F01_bin.150]
MTTTIKEPLSFLSCNPALSLNQDKKDTRNVYLKFYINPETPALLSMKNIQEAAVLSSQLLTTMPNMPPYILGLTNRRSRVMWVVDISQMIGLRKISFITPKIDILIVKISGFISALAVHRIEGTMRVSSEEVNATPNHITPALIPYLEGCVLKDRNIFLVLDAEAIAQSSLLHKA